MQRLNLSPNSEDETPQEQLNQIRLALKNINSWGNKQSSQLAVNFIDSDTANITINSSDQQGLGLSFAFIPNSALQHVCGTIDISTTGLATIYFNLGNIETFKLNINNSNRQTYPFSFYITANAGETVNLNIKGAGNLVKYGATKNKVQIVTQ